MTHNFFIEEGQILANMAKLADTPIVIIHGRYDMVCPVSGAWKLHEACADSELIIVPDAGHSGSEYAAETIKATDVFSRIL